MGGGKVEGEEEDPGTKNDPPFIVYFIVYSCRFYTNTQIRQLDL